MKSLIFVGHTANMAVGTIEESPIEDQGQSSSPEPLHIDSQTTVISVGQQRIAQNLSMKTTSVLLDPHVFVTENPYDSLHSRGTTQNKQESGRRKIQDEPRKDSSSRSCGNQDRGSNDQMMQYSSRSVSIDPTAEAKVRWAMLASLARSSHKDRDDQTNSPSAFSTGRASLITQPWSKNDQEGSRDMVLPEIGVKMPTGGNSVSPTRGLDVVENRNDKNVHVFQMSASHANDSGNSRLDDELFLPEVPIDHRFSCHNDARDDLTETVEEVEHLKHRSNNLNRQEDNRGNLISIASHMTPTSMNPKNSTASLEFHEIQDLLPGHLREHFDNDREGTDSHFTNAQQDTRELETLKSFTYGESRILHRSAQRKSNDSDYRSNLRSDPADSVIANICYSGKVYAESVPEDLASRSGSGAKPVSQSASRDGRDIELEFFERNSSRIGSEFGRAKDVMEQHDMGKSIDKSRVLVGGLESKKIMGKGRKESQKQERTTFTSQVAPNPMEFGETAEEIEQPINSPRCELRGEDREQHLVSTDSRTAQSHIKSSSEAPKSHTSFSAITIQSTMEAQFMRDNERHLSNEDPHDPRDLPKGSLETDTGNFSGAVAGLSPAKPAIERFVRKPPSSSSRPPAPSNSQYTMPVGGRLSNIRPHSPHPVRPECTNDKIVCLNSRQPIEPSRDESRAEGQSEMKSPETGQQRPPDDFQLYQPEHGSHLYSHTNSERLLDCSLDRKHRPQANHREPIYQDQSTAPSAEKHPARNEGALPPKNQEKVLPISPLPINNQHSTARQQHAVASHLQHDMLHTGSTRSLSDHTKRIPVQAYQDEACHKSSIPPTTFKSWESEEDRLMSQEFQPRTSPNLLLSDTAKPPRPDAQPQMVKQGVPSSQRNRSLERSLCGPHMGPDHHEVRAHEDWDDYHNIQKQVGIQGTSRSTEESKTTLLCPERSHEHDRTRHHNEQYLQESHQQDSMNQMEQYINTLHQQSNNVFGGTGESPGFLERKSCF